jgi:hypothetical protein
MSAGGARSHDSKQFHRIHPSESGFSPREIHHSDPSVDRRGAIHLPRNDTRSVGTPGPWLHSNHWQSGKRSRGLAGHDGPAPGSHNSGSSARRGLSAPKLSAGKQLSCNQAALFRRGKLGAAGRSEPDLPSTSQPFKGNTARGLSCCAGADFGVHSHEAASFPSLKTELKTNSSTRSWKSTPPAWGTTATLLHRSPLRSLQFLINLLRKKLRSRRSCLYRGCGRSHRVSSARKQAALRQTALEVSNDGN